MQIKAFKYQIKKYRTVDSTNAEAKRLALSGAIDRRTVIIAESQTAGRGRGTRRWQNTEGALLMTIADELALPSASLPLLGFAAAIAVKNAVGWLTDGKCVLSVKWPNDLLAEGTNNKLCGILSESFSINNKLFYAVGVGLNLNAAFVPEGLLQPASSVYLESGVKLDPEETACEIAGEFSGLADLLKNDPGGFMDIYRQSCATIGKRAAVSFAEASEAACNGASVRWGEALNVAEDGALTVRFEDGSVQNVYAADVSVRACASLDDALARKLLPFRDPKGNKGSNGRAAMIVGSPSMPGAALMSTAAAVRAGAGLTKALIPKELAPAFAALPEAMLLTDDLKAEELISWASAIGIGCGMGVSERTAALLKSVLASGKPCVIDADGLNTLSKHDELKALLHPNCALTPHPAEMARLCGKSTDEVLADLTGAALDFSKAHNCTVLLKSAVSVTASPEGSVRYNTSGNSGLAKGGSGDVLCGLVAGLLAQGASPFDAASLGSYLLGCSAETALGLLRERFITASDVTDAVSITLNRIKT